MMTDRRLALFGFAIGIVGYCAAGSPPAITWSSLEPRSHWPSGPRWLACLRHSRVMPVPHADSARCRGRPRSRMCRSAPERSRREPSSLASCALASTATNDSLPNFLPIVMLHELAHQRARDPLRLVLLDVVAPLRRPLPTGRAWLAWAAAQPEIRADQHALSHGVSRSNLAAALLAMGGHGRSFLAGSPTAIDLRLQALLGEPAEPDVDRRVVGATVTFVGVAAGAAVCAWFLHRLIVTTASAVAG